jgi:capsid portal protein
MLLHVNGVSGQKVSGEKCKTAVTIEISTVAAVISLDAPSFFEFKILPFNYANSE